MKISIPVLKNIESMPTPPDLQTVHSVEDNIFSDFCKILQYFRNTMYFKTSDLISCIDGKCAYMFKNVIEKYVAMHLVSMYLVRICGHIIRVPKAKSTQSLPYSS